MAAQPLDSTLAGVSAALAEHVLIPRNHRFNMLRGVKFFEVGPLNSDGLVTNHQLAIEHHLKSSSSNLDHQAIEYISEMTPFAKKRLLGQIVALSHGSLRLMLSLWGGFLRSVIAHSIWRQRRADPDSPRGYEYELLDALIVGACDALNQRRHRIANLFAMGHAHDRPRDLLIGPHAMFLMQQGMNRQSSLSETLISLGYSHNNIQDAVMALSAFNILHLVPSSRLGSNEFELHDPVIAEYVDLIWEPAYIDNIAMVTHVDPGLRSHMHRTRGDRTEDFTRRVETTLVFLRFLRTCEQSFRDSSQLRPGVDPDEFRMSLTKLKIRSIWRGMALAYRAASRA